MIHGVRFENARGGRSLATLAVMMLTLVACGADASSSGAQLKPSPTDTASFTTVGFTAPLVGGGTFSLSDALTNKPVALWFWAPG